MRSSDIFFVSVVISTRSPRSSRRRISLSRSSIWFFVGRSSISGSTMPVGRISCSATTGRVAQLPRAGRRRDEHDLVHLLEELVEAQRPVVERRRQPEAEVDERLLARAVALVHAADLRHGLVRLVDEDHVVRGEVVEQRVRRRARRAAVEDARVVLDPVAEPELLHHLEVVLGALPDPVRLEHPALVVELLDLLLELLLDLDDGALDRRLRGDVLRGREDRDRVEPRQHLAGQRVEVRDRLDLVAEERDAVRRLRVRRLDLEHVALDAEAARGRAACRCGRTGCRSACAARGRGRAARRPSGRPSSARTPPASRGRRCS